MPHRSASTTEDDSAVVRKCLRGFAKGLQRRGEIPLDVSVAELYSAVGAARSHDPGRCATQCYVPRMEEHRAPGREPQVCDPPNVENTAIIRTGRGHRSNLMRSRSHRQDTYAHVEAPGCGGTVYPSKHDTFRCNASKKTGALGADMPEGLNPQRADAIHAHQG